MKFISVYCYRIDEVIKDFGVIPTTFGDYESAYKAALESVKSSAELGGYIIDDNNPLICYKNVGGSVFKIEYAIDQLV